MRSIEVSRESMPSSSPSTTWSLWMRPSRVFETASGCSLISFAMKLDQPPFSTAEASHDTSYSWASTPLPVEVGHRDGIGGDRDDLVLADLHGAPRVLDEGGDVGAEEVLAVAEADDEGGVAASADDDARLVLVQGEQGEGSLEAGDDTAERGGEAALSLEVLPAQQLGGDLGVGLALEGVAVGEQFVAQNGEVLDDAVVDQGDAAVGAEVGMRVDVGGAAVRRPAGVADARAPVGAARMPSRSSARTASFPARLRVTRSPESVMIATPAESYPRYSRRPRPPIRTSRLELLPT